MLWSVNTIADIETLYARLGERDYEAVMSYLADDIVWIVADNSPLAGRSPYHGIAEVRSGVFERLTAGFEDTKMCDASGSCSARMVSTTASTSRIALVSFSKA